MAGAGLFALEFTVEMAADIRATRGMGPSMAHAHRHLTRLRAERDSGYIEYVDLTHSELFDWRHWLARRPDVGAYGS